jgi:Zn-dependent protease/CBS domain-containing protein
MAGPPRDTGRSRTRHAGESHGPMHTDVRLGSIGGVEIGLNWTWLIVVGLITWSLAAEVFPVTNRGLDSEAYIAMALAATLLYFASLLLHELAHALQARREGMEVSGITLWAFGGVARFNGTFPSAAAEFRVAFAGPLVTLLLSVAFLTAATLLSLPAAVDAVISWLGRMNLLLFAFNMLPALPLDGGRVLHAILWKARGSLAWATRVAARIGVLFGGLMIALGAAIALEVDFVSGVWLSLIGWFVMAAAQAESSTMAAREALSGLHVSDAMVRHPVTVHADQTLRDVIDHVFSHSRHAAYPVTENGDALGILSSRSVTSLSPDSWTRVRVRDRMIPADKALTLADGDDLADAAAALAQTSPQRALVLHAAKLTGLLSITDVQRLFELRRREGRRQ